MLCAKHGHHVDIFFLSIKRLKASFFHCAALVAAGVYFLSSSQLLSAQANSALAAKWAESPPDNPPAVALEGGERAPIKQGAIPTIMQLPEEARYLFWGELNAGKLHIIEQTGQDLYRIERTIPVSIGKNGAGKQREGDLGTPIGVYQITSYIPGPKLPDFYGPGAYPINYPNNWDKLQARTGYGIWLHGLPSGIEARPKLDSEGCVVLDNNSLREIDPYISLKKTTVILSEAPPFPEPSHSSDHSQARSSQSLLDALEQWRVDWESRDTQAYVSHYNPETFAPRGYDNFAAWSAYKVYLNETKTFISVTLDSLSAIQYPGEDGLVRVHYHQNYRSSNFNWSGWKEMFWRQNADGAWQIIHEGSG